MDIQFFGGLFLGFVFAFLVLKFTINKSGYGELKMCRQKCPYYRSVELNRGEEEGNEDE